MKAHPKRFDDVKRVSVAALALAVLAQGCLSQSAPAPPGDADAKHGAPAASPSPVQAAQSVPAAPAAPAAPATAAGESPLPPPVGFVNDFANVIDAATRERLEAWLGRLKARTKIEVAVATVETTGERSVYDYSLAVARGWGIGPPAGEEGGGVLLLLAVKDRKWRVQVTRSLEPELPDEVVGEIGGRMTPALREGRYGEAVLSCVDGLVKRLAERRGFSTKDDELLPQASPEAEPKAPEKSKVKSKAAP
jgi:uncharacterized membrane protein YgcG